MKYLSFDIECCDGKHICEFGYVFADERFNILKKECITINPEHKFKLTGRAHERDIALSFPDDVYFNSPTFEYYYDKIKNLLTSAEYSIIGFSTKNDINFLRVACEEYNKEPILFSCIDIQKLYQGYTKAGNRTSIEKIIDELKIGNVKIHKSDDDSFAVIKILETISKKERLSFPETLDMMKERYKKWKTERIKNHNCILLEKARDGNKKAQCVFLKKHIEKLEVSKIKKDDLFFGKTICISSAFQYKRFDEFLLLIKQIYFYGASYTGKASVCDIFIDYDNDGKEVRYISAVQAIKEGRAILFLSLAEAKRLLKMS